MVAVAETVTVAFNRTSMESKPMLLGVDKINEEPFNRTSMESKHPNSVEEDDSGILF